MRIRKIVLIAVLLVAVSGYLVAQNEKPAVGEKDSSEIVLAEVNNTKITVADFNKEVANMPPNYQKYVQANKEKFVDDLVMRELFYQQAKKDGIEKDPEYIKQLEEIKKKVLAQMLLLKTMEKAEVTTEEAKKYYEENKKEYEVPEQIEAAHILIKIEDPGDEAADKAALQKAEEVLKKVNEGGDFAELAKENSSCPSSAKGGALGSFPRGAMVPEFEEAAFSLKEGEISGIVKTKFGYHIIKLIKKVPAQTQTFAEVEDQIKETLLQEKKKAAVETLNKELREKAKITVNKEAIESM